VHRLVSGNETSLTSPRARRRIGVPWCRTPARRSRETASRFRHRCIFGHSQSIRRRLSAAASAWIRRNAANVRTRPPPRGALRRKRTFACFTANAHVPRL